MNGDQVEPDKTDESVPGQMTPKMIHAILWKMLKDVGPVMCKQEFFDDFPEDMKFECQYDETNKLWRFFVPQKRERKLFLPDRKVIGHG